MTVASVISRGIGPGSTIETVILRGLEVGEVILVPSISSFSTPIERHSNQQLFNRQVSQYLKILSQGKSNNVISVTLDANGTTTTVTDARIGVNTVALCIPITATAAAETPPYRDTSSPVK